MAHEIIHKVRSRRALYCAVLLHDIAKAAAATIRCSAPRSPMKLLPAAGASTKTRPSSPPGSCASTYCLSATAQKRDLSDCKTIADFVEVVQSLDRLRQLTAAHHRRHPRGRARALEQLKRQLLASSTRAEERLRLGHASTAATSGSRPRRRAWPSRLGATPAGRRLGKLLGDAYWIAEPDDIIAMNLTQLGAAKGAR
jgi:[protein-PII] uridylyltransferase